MVNTRTLSANEIRSNHITQQRQRLGRKRIDTRYSNARFHYEDRFNIEDISDRLIDIDSQYYKVNQQCTFFSP